MNRRSFLGSVGATAGAATLLPAFLTKRVSAKPRNANRGSSNSSDHNPTVQSTLDPWVPGVGEWNVTTINHLYRRAGFGATMAEVAAAMQSSPGAVVDALLADSLTTQKPLPPANSDKWLNVTPYLGSDYNTQIAQQTLYANAMMSIRVWWTGLMSAPETMMRERMVTFWANHFVVEESSVYYPQMMYYYLDYFRQHPWGNFKQMVKDVSIMPAMLYYLGGYANVGKAPNENYARELMELFTLGINDQNGNPNYTQADVVAMARALTGWTFDTTATVPPAATVLPAMFVVGNHDATFKKIFTQDSKNFGLAASGDPDTVDVIDWLFTQRGSAIAYFICGELYQAFVYHDTTTANAQTIIQGMAATFQSNNWELKPVLAELLMSQHFYDPTNIGAQIKSPYDYMIGMLRSFNQPVDETNAGTLFYYGYYDGNQELLDPPNVKGWPGYRTWISTTTLPARNDTFAGPFVNSAIPGIGADGFTGIAFKGFGMTDTQLTTWAKQFQHYSGAYTDFLNDVASYMCAFVPSATVLQNRIGAKLPQNYYEWPTLSDTDKLATIRVVVGQLMLLANYQLA